jgi:hypothetical protein
VVFEDCSLKGGVRQTLLPFAILALCVYTVTYPCVLFYILFKNHMRIMEDQLLRAEDRWVPLPMRSLPPTPFVAFGRACVIVFD